MTIVLAEPATVASVTAISPPVVALTGNATTYTFAFVGAVPSNTTRVALALSPGACQVRHIPAFACVHTYHQTIVYVRGMVEEGN